MRNKIAWKLTLYFAIALLVFALVVGGSFAHFFRQHTVEMKKEELQLRAVRISEIISDSMNVLKNRYGDSIGQSRFIRYIDNITMEDVWVIDENRQLNVGDTKINHHQKKMRHRMQGMGMGNPQLPKDDELPTKQATANFKYKDLPLAIKHSVDKAFQGEVSLAEDFNPVLEELMISAAAPVRDNSGAIRAVVLLHYPVQGLSSATWEGVKILLLSCLSALLLVFVLSMVFSWKFTKPLSKMREVAEKFSERDYTERCNIKQNDEIGALALTLDSMGERLWLADEAGKKLEKLRRDFIANISHELRTPVTVIRGSLEALRDKVVTEPVEVEAYHEQMLAESLFLQRLINDLLDLSRLQNTDFPIEKTPLNLCDVVRDVVRSSQQLGKAKNITIGLELEQNPYVLEGDYGRLRQMLLIFLDNAIKFSQSGGAIEVALANNKLTVTDHGSGVKSEDLPFVFDRFYKARVEANKSGSGLGLAISKQIAERHKIELSMSSIPNVATTVLLELPPALREVKNDELWL